MLETISVYSTQESTDYIFFNTKLCILKNYPFTGTVYSTENEEKAVTWEKSLELPLCLPGLPGDKNILKVVNNEIHRRR